MPRKLLPAATNVLRFPVERRARLTLELMRELAPDIGDVLAVIDMFGEDRPLLALRDQTDADAANYIGMRAGGDTVMPHDRLDNLLDAMVAHAIPACWSLRDASAATNAARRLLGDAQAAGQEWLSLLHAQVDERRAREVKLLIEAHARVEEAEGVARAVGFAKRGDTWTARNDPHENAGIVAWAVDTLMLEVNVPPLPLRARLRNAASALSTRQAERIESDDGPCAA